MLTGIDHLVIAVDDPDAAVEELAAVLGLTAGGGGRHDGLGTSNRLLWLGDTYIELIGVDDPDLARASWIGAPALRRLAHGGGLATWAIASDAIEADVGALRAAGSSLAEPMDGQRIRPDGATVRWRLSAAPELGPDLPPFLIEHDTTAAEWTPVDRADRARELTRLRSVELSVDDALATTRRFERTLGLTLRTSRTDRGVFAVTIGRQTLHIRPRGEPGTPPAIVHLSDANGEPRSLDRFGCRWAVGA